MMLYPAMRDLLKKIPSRYQMVNMVAHRAVRSPPRRRWPGSLWTTSR